LALVLAVPLLNLPYVQLITYLTMEVSLVSKELMWANPSSKPLHHRNQSDQQMNC